MIKVGYLTHDGEDILHETVDDMPAANASVFDLRKNKQGDTTIKTFYLKQQITDTEWDYFCDIDPL